MAMYLRNALIWFDPWFAGAVSAIASGAARAIQISSTRMPCTRTIERSIIELLARILIIRGMDA
jgi:hypothetical protein